MKILFLLLVLTGGHATAAQTIQTCDSKTNVCRDIVIPDNPDRFEGSNGVWTTTTN